MTAGMPDNQRKTFQCAKFRAAPPWYVEATAVDSVSYAVRQSFISSLTGAFLIAMELYLMIRMSIMSNQVLRILGAIALALTASTVFAQQPVIPGAAGFGINTPAGRRGEIIRVTNLADSGPGSLRDCVDRSGPRVCIFDVSGVIRLKSGLDVKNPFLTIAGQTAPSPGIMLRGAALEVRASDVLVQHIAVRAGDDNSASADTRDALQVIGYSSPVRNVVIDHCSFSWSVDEVAELWFDFDNITFLNNIFSEPLHDSIHSKGIHGYGFLIESRSAKVSFVGNLFAHGFDRNPRAGVTDFVFVNNVVYDAASRAMALHNASGLASKNSVAGNVFKRTPQQPIHLDTAYTPLQQGTRLYLSDNLGEQGSSDQWSLVRNGSQLSRSDIETSSAPTWPNGLAVLPTSGGVALNHVLNNAGARSSDRNAVDARVVAEVRNGTGQVINCVESDGSSRCSKNAGGWPQYAENNRRLELPSNPNGDDDADGYTNLEEFLHNLAVQVEGPSSNAPRPNPPQLTQVN